MKKYLIIPLAICFLSISCTKIQPNPFAVSTEVIDGKPAPREDQCFTITNIEHDNGIVEYKLSFIDCNKVYHSMLLPIGKSVSSCLWFETIQTNFAYDVRKCK